jgi:hypothetical protein
MVHGYSRDEEERYRQMVRDLYERAGAATAAQDDLQTASLTVAEIKQIEQLLDEKGALPISTPALLDKMGLGGRHGTVLRLLNRLARLREVEKIELEDMRCLYWRRWQHGNTPVPQLTEYDYRPGLSRRPQHTTPEEPR